MSFNFFKKKGNDADAEAEGGSTTPAAPRDPRKAKAWLERAQTVADSHQHEYAIECFINGLKQDPANLAAHEALREVAFRRHVAGGKPSSLGERFKGSGKDPVERMLHAELLWTKDPANLGLMVNVMDRAVELHQSEPDIGTDAVARWVGLMVLNLASKQDKPPLKAILRARDLFANIRSFDKAVECCKLAMSLDRLNPEIQQSLRNLEAELAMQQAHYDTATVKDANFRVSVRDQKKQRDLMIQDTIARTGGMAQEQVQSRRAELEAAPDDMDLLTKLAETLLGQDEQQAMEEAAALYQRAWEKTDQYRFKMRQGDVRIRLLDQALRQAKAALDANPDAAAARKAYQDHVRQKAEFELQEYTERSEKYPTDMKQRFELGRRLFYFKRYEEAIAAFQQAQVNPGFKAPALEYLGRCYLAKGWLDEAIQTLRKGIDAHPLSDDRLGLELRYILMDTYYQAALKKRSVELAREAQQIGSQVLQANIQYRDIRQRMDTIRALQDELSKESNSSSR